MRPAYRGITAVMRLSMPSSKSWWTKPDCWSVPCTSTQSAYWSSLN